MVLFLYITANAQCSIDTLISSPGIYPDSITNLDEAFVGQPYITQIDVLTPLDTVVNFNGLTLNVTISHIDLTSVLGLPNNFSYSCNPPSCSFPGGTYACAEIFSTVDPSVSDGCREDKADFILDKDKANFCDYFKANPKAYKKLDKKEATTSS